jgi:hypothetical protein
VVVVVVGGSVVVVVGGDVVLVVVGGMVVVEVGVGVWLAASCANVEVVLLGREDAPALVAALSIMTRQRESRRTALANRTMASLTVQRTLPAPPPAMSSPLFGRAEATTTKSVECGPALTELVIKDYAVGLGASSEPLRSLGSAARHSGGANWPHG